MIDLKLNTEIVQTLKKHKFYPDTMLTQYLILRCLYDNNQDLLSLFDDNLTSRRFVIQYYELTKKGLVEESANALGFELTPNGKLFVEHLDSMNKPPKKEGVSEWFDEWLDLFPAGVKTGGKLVRSDAKACLKKMETFVKERGFSKDVIMQATKEYLEEFEANNYAFVKSATYFIDKRGEGSELAARCENLKQKPKDEFEVFDSGGLV